MAPILLWLILVLCLSISVVKYLMGIILKFSFPSTKAQKDYTYQPTVSVLMPCYNEGKTVYETIESISKSNYPSDKFEVIAQDDCSGDDSYEWMLKAQRDFTNIRITTGRNEVNSGKARSVCNALQHSTAEIIISIDSDCIFHPDAIRELTACFAEPRIGSVGGRVGVRNPNDSVITSIQTVIYYSAFQLYRFRDGPGSVLLKSISRGSQLFRLQLHQDSSYTSHVPGDGRWRHRSFVERGGLGGPLGILRAAEGRKSRINEPMGISNRVCRSVRGSSQSQARDYSDAKYARSRRLGGCYQLGKRR